MIGIIICCCYKYYKNYELCYEKWKNIIVAYPFINFFFIFGTPGSTNYDENTHVLQLDVDDDYDSLPKKICKAYQFIMDNYPHIEGIFKTDDDIDFTNNCGLVLELVMALQNGDNYCGIFIDKTRPMKICTARLKKFNNLKSNIIYSHDGAIYCHGAGYYISKKSAMYICSNIEYVSYRHLEDVTIGYILNKYGIFPTQLYSECREIPRII